MPLILAGFDGGLVAEEPSLFASESLLDLSKLTGCRLIVAWPSLNPNVRIAILARTVATWPACCSRKRIQEIVFRYPRHVADRGVQCAKGC
jgi:hypothetical protein